MPRQHPGVPGIAVPPHGGHDCSILDGIWFREAVARIVTGWAIACPACAFGKTGREGLGSRLGLEGVKDGEVEAHLGLSL